MLYHLFSPIKKATEVAFLISDVTLAVVAELVVQREHAFRNYRVHSSAQVHQEFVVFHVA
ncbi:hypothetical protein D3C79_1075290 [compost metagenome]